MFPAEEQAPLLPREARVGNASVSGAVFNVSTSIIGAGIMSIPATFKILGAIPALVLIVLVALLTHVSVDFLLKFTYSGRSSTYAGMMAESFGRVGSYLIQISIITITLGCLTIYLIIIGDVLSGSGSGKGVLQEWFGVHWWNSRKIALLFVVVFALLPLVSYRRVESLRFSSGVSVLLAVVFVGISSGLAVTALFQGRAYKPRLLPRFDGEASILDLFTAIPVIVTAFTFHFNVHPIGMELGKARDMMVAVRIALLLCAVIYFMTGLFGYLLFGESIMSDFLVNFNRSSGVVGSALNDVVRLSYALHLVLVFPLLNFSLRSNVDELIFPRRRPLAQDTKRFVCWTCFLVGLCYGAAIAIPSIWFFFQFVGSTGAVSVAFIFPGAIALRDVHGICTLKEKIIAGLMVPLAVATSVVAIFANIYDKSTA